MMSRCVHYQRSVHDCAHNTIQITVSIDGALYWTAGTGAPTIRRRGVGAVTDTEVKVAAVFVWCFPVDSAGTTALIFACVIPCNYPPPAVITGERLFWRVNMDSFEAMRVSCVFSWPAYIC